ncbi:MAG: hypothetical protein AB7K71_11820 [Polyangiaceae bacterium]
MAWTIESWDPATRTGTLRSPHFAGVPFGPAENVQNVTDFAIGETVVVEFAEVEPTHVLRAVTPTRQRQPKDTHIALFDVVNGYLDVQLEEHSPGRLVLWLGDCCEYCTPDAPRLVFEGLTTDQLSSAWEADTVELSNPLFRGASAEEIATHQLDVPEGARAYCVVTSHGSGPDGPKLFLVARSVSVMESAAAH